MSDVEEATAELLKWAAVAGDLYKSLLHQGLPEQLSSDLTFDWLCLRDDE